MMVDIINLRTKMTPDICLQWLRQEAIVNGEGRTFQLK